MSAFVLLLMVLTRIPQSPGFFLPADFRSITHQLWELACLRSHQLGLYWNRVDCIASKPAPTSECLRNPSQREQTLEVLGSLLGETLVGLTAQHGQKLSYFTYVLWQVRFAAIGDRGQVR